MMNIRLRHKIHVLWITTRMEVSHKEYCRLRNCVQRSGPLQQSRTAPSENVL